MQKQECNENKLNQSNQLITRDIFCNKCDAMVGCYKHNGENKYHDIIPVMGVIITKIETFLYDELESIGHILKVHFKCNKCNNIISITTQEDFPI